MIILNSKKVEKALFGIIAGLFVATLPGAVVADDQSPQNQSERGIHNSSKQPENEYQKHIKINNDNSSDHNYSIAPKRRQIHQQRSQQNRNSRQSLNNSN